MPEGLMTEDGQAVPLADTSEQDFARAMAAPEPDEPVAPAPPKRPTEDELGAKYGWTTDPVSGQRRAKRAAGRPKARTTDARPQKAPKAGKDKGEDKSTADFSAPLSEFTGALWMVMAAAPVPAEPVRIKVRAQAKVLRDQQPGVVQGLNIMAQNNATIRRGVELLTMGSAGWVLPATMALAPFCVQSAQVWKMDPDELRGMAQATETEWEATFKAMQAEVEQMQADLAAEYNGQEQAA